MEDRKGSLDKYPLTKKAQEMLDSLPLCPSNDSNCTLRRKAIELLFLTAKSEHALELIDLGAHSCCKEDA